MESRPQTQARFIHLHAERRESWVFSLIELLVVIVVIGLWASLLLQVLSKAKAAAHSTVCQSSVQLYALAARKSLDDHAPDGFVQNCLPDNRTRHAGRFHIALCDGHVEAMPPRDLFDVRRDDVVQRCYRDHIPHREMGEGLF